MKLLDEGTLFLTQRSGWCVQIVSHDKCIESTSPENKTLCFSHEVRYLYKFLHIKKPQQYLSMLQATPDNKLRVTCIATLDSTKPTVYFWCKKEPEPEPEPEPVKKKKKRRRKLDSIRLKCHFTPIKSILL